MRYLPPLAENNGIRFGRKVPFEKYRNHPLNRMNWGSLKRAQIVSLDGFPNHCLNEEKN